MKSHSNVCCWSEIDWFHFWIQSIVVLLAADIYAIGFQEIVDLNAGNLLVDHNANKAWEDKIEHTLKQQYIQVSSKHLVGLSLCVYVKRGLFQEVSDISAETVGVGIMGVGGNKGAVGIRFNLYNSSICFVNCHLAAHQHNSAGRNSDYQNICARLLFQDAKSKIQKGAKVTLFEHESDIETLEPTRMCNTINHFQSYDQFIGTLLHHSLPSPSPLP